MDILPARGRRRREAAKAPVPVPSGTSSSGGSPAGGPHAEPDAAPVAGRRRRDGGRRPRTGRNLPVAIGVGVVLGALVAASLFVRKEGFLVLCAVAVVISVWELTQAFAVRRIHLPLVPVVVGSLGMLVSAYVSGEEALLVAFALTALGALVWRVLEGLEGAVRDVAAGVFAAAYVPFLAGFAMLMLAADDGPLRIVVFILVTVASDIGGFAVGVVWGRHPMAPSVSPKKSWEGLAGSALFCLGTGVAAVVLLLDGPWWAGALLGVAAVVTSTVGDLSESLLKRDLGIKDMGSLLPGHGGILDRLDSLLPTAPVVYLALAVLVPAGA